MIGAKRLALSMLLARGRPLLIRSWPHRSTTFKRTFQFHGTTTTALNQEIGSFQGKSVAQVLDESIKILNDANAPEPVESTVNLLSSSLNLSWESGYRELLQILSSPPPSTTIAPSLSQRLLNETESQTYQEYLKRRMKHEPIQYILGQWDFMEYRIQIRPPLLCPRPETEELVDLVLKNHEAKRNVRILDIGCGTGCIGIALAEKMGDRVEVLAIDVNPIAIETTRENAKAILGKSKTISHRFQAELIPVQDYTTEVPFDVIVSNPPYIPSADMSSLDPTVAQYESHQALDGGHDGMDIIRIILARLDQWLCKGGSCWMEVDPSQPKLLNQLVDQMPGFVYGGTFKDLQGKDRFVHIKRVS